jgi:hypothetical protein
MPYTDAVLGISLDVPSSWQVDAMPGAATHFYQEQSGAGRTVLTFSVLNPESNTLEAALEEVKNGAWGSYIQGVQREQLGVFEALRLELMPGSDRPPVIWLMVTPSARAVGFIPGIAPSQIKAVLDTLCPAE